MRIDTLTDRITNAKAKIEKKQNTIEKKEKLILKKEAEIRKLGFNPQAEREDIHRESSEAFWLICDIKHLKEDIMRGTSEIEETKISLKKYEAQLAGELDKEYILLNDIPASMKRMQTELVERWDAWDIDRRNKMRIDIDKLGWKAFREKYIHSDLDFRNKTDEEIHNSNINDAKCLILDLYYRVKEITGTITDWSGISAEEGACGLTVLNGYVVGKEGRAIVESILAGGYNVQRLHIRVIVKECK